MGKSIDFVIWDDPEDPSGNVQHIIDNDLTTDEVEDVLYDPEAEDVVSRTTGRPAKWGYTSTGRRIFVVFDIENDDPLWVRPRTAYEPPEM